MVYSAIMIFGGIKMKKILSVFLTVCLCFILFGCGNKKVVIKVNEKVIEDNEKVLRTYIIENSELFDYDEMEYVDIKSIKSANLEFISYGAEYFDCELNYLYKETESTISQISFIVKAGKVYKIMKMIDKTYVYDIDNDGNDELIYYTNFGSGLSCDTYYLVDKDTSEILSVAQLSAWPEKVENNKLLITGDLLCELALRDTDKGRELYLQTKDN